MVDVCVCVVLRCEPSTLLMVGGVLGYCPFCVYDDDNDYYCCDRVFL